LRISSEATADKTLRRYKPVSQKPPPYQCPAARRLLYAGPHDGAAGLVVAWDVRGIREWS
jgi:hypothetical protein